MESAQSEVESRVEVANTNAQQSELNTPSPEGGNYWPQKFDLLGVGVSFVDYQEAVACIARAAKDLRSGVVGCYSVHALVTASSDGELRRAVNDFEMVTPDGQPVRWGMNLLHKTQMSDRVYGPELTLRVCEAAADAGLPIYLYGGTPETIERLMENLLQEFPNLQIAGFESPPFRQLSEEENDEVCKRINDSGARITLIGLGCPKQDYFAIQNKNRIKSVMMCVGAAFDFHAGAKPMAPEWMQKRGLEWVFRLSCEPHRLWRRYLVTNSIYVGKLGVAAIRSGFSR